MKNITMKFVLTVIMTLVGFGGGVSAQNAVNAQAAESLDLHAVAELFKDSENLEKFEQALNNAGNGINNLDLNDNGQIDFIRVTEQSKDNNRLIILQSVLGENEFQDVATIAVEKQNGDKYDIQIQGEQTIYGANYFVVPANNNFSAWNVVRWIFSPRYRVYVSPYSYALMPGWWTVRRPVALNVYRANTGILLGRKNFIAARTVKPINRIVYRPRTSTIVTRKPVVVRAATANPKPAIQTRTVTTINRRNTVQTTTTTKITPKPKRGRN